MKKTWVSTVGLWIVIGWYLTFIFEIMTIENSISGMIVGVALIVGGFKNET